MIEVSEEFLQEILEDLYDLRGEWSWKKDDPRCRNGGVYDELCGRILFLETRLGKEK